MENYNNSSLITHHSSLNIICFDVPFPADYGGAMEEFYKIKSLHQLGIKIYLHCFVYGDRIAQKELEKYCEKVFYYERKRSIKDVFSNLPFIVKTRMSDELLQNLLTNDFPILFDATHTTGFLHHPSLQNRKKIVRLHNIEWIYYNVLFHSAISPKERIFYFLEYKKLKKYDKVLENADVLSCLSQTDFEYYQDKFPDKKISLEFVFHENEAIKCKTGKGKYILYHGNLSLLDNYQIIINLLSNELKDCKHPIFIAGKNPSQTLIDFVKNKSNVQLVANPTNDKMEDLIVNAHICFAIAKNPSGVKLKLINSMYRGRFIFANEDAFIGSGLEACVVNITDADVQALIDEYMQKDFTHDEIDKRVSLLSEKYDNQKNAKQLISLI